MTSEGLSILRGTLQGEKNINKQGQNMGLELHHDKGNRGFAVILVFGAAIEGWDQLWPTLGCEVPCGVWSYSVGDAESVMHGVGPGSGLRIVLVFCVHAVMARGVDHLGRKVEWGKKTQSASK
tara:strand:- start:598 stop:966 length:369 start_codon:yes stop_codon:yes gene_type:complete